MQIRGADNLTAEELAGQLARGGRIVFFEYCISLLVVTLRRPSEMHFLPAGERGIVRGLPYTLVSLILGWWGIPWGFIYTPLTLFTNLSGGRDVTAELRPLLARTSL